LQFVLVGFVLKKRGFCCGLSHPVFVFINIPTFKTYMLSEYMLLDVFFPASNKKHIKVWGW